MVRGITVPPDARALSTLTHIDYEDAFLVDVGDTGERTAEQWARAIFDGAPGRVRRSLWVSWFALGLRLGSPRSPRHVLGWEVRRSKPDFALLGARSRIGMPAELLVKRQTRTQLLFDTFVQKENPLARAVWATIEPRHEPIVKHVMEQAARRVQVR
jgi:hypothetical protein